MAQQSMSGFGVANPVSYAPAPPETVDIRDPKDTNPSEMQPPGVDEEREPQSLEEALLGE